MMSWSGESRAYLEIHLAVLLFGFTAILGDLIQAPVVMLIWWRLLFTLFSLVFMVRIGRLFRDFSLRAVLPFVGVGVLVSLQWATFYGSIRLANASVTLVAVASTSLFTALLEPLLLRQKIRWLDVGLGLLIIPGMAMVINYVKLDMLLGLGVALLSSAFAAAYTSLNKKLIGRSDPLRITFLELGSAWILVSAFLPIYFSSTSTDWSAFWPSGADWFYIICLALACTTLAYVLTLRSLRHLSAFAANLTVNLEPVYGMILAWLILKEHKEFSPGFYGGVAVIMLAVFSYPVLRRRFR